HHGHDADEVFVSWGVETAKKFTKAELESAIEELDAGLFGAVLRAKGIVDGGDVWYEFDMVPGELEFREAKPDVIGKLVVIGSKLDTGKIAELFGV
ncbi:MAG: GTP-binding protein, partial [Oscillospiraceae bacterium]|nr:GTP-binding protein [Oscillospiraceae bacterium]